MTLTDRGIIDSRTKAQAFILAGRIKVDGQVVTKSGTLVSDDQVVELIEGARYVSRGGEKLAGALKDFDLSPKGKTCLDIGSSTGGFTDCLLQNGATKIHALDVGKGQLDIKLRNDSRVKVQEETHILSITQEDLDPDLSWITIDVSFISLKKVLPHVKMLAPKDSVILALIKPQFEVGAKFLKKGVVRSDEVRDQAVNDLTLFSKELGFEVVGTCPSHLKGPKGNQEFFNQLRNT